MLIVNAIDNQHSRGNDELNPLGVHSLEVATRATGVTLPGSSASFLLTSAGLFQ
jgi:hypothetical protein